MTEEHVPEPRDEMMAKIIRDVEVLMKAGILEIQGITDEGKWLYGLTREAKDIVEELIDEDIDVITQVLMDFAENRQNDEE